MKGDGRWLERILQETVLSPGTSRKAHVTGLRHQAPQSHAYGQYPLLPSTL